MQEKEQSVGLGWVVVGGAALSFVMVAASSRWPDLFAPGATGSTVSFPFAGAARADATSGIVHPLIELMKLVAAALIGVVVTAVHKRCHRDKPLHPSMVQAQMLLAVSGALMMIIIGESLARAFGIAGAAAIIRFRTPVKDPKDAAILFLLMGLGMSAGLGAFAVAGLGTFFLCILLLVLDRMTHEQTKARKVLLEVVAHGNEFPTEHVQRVFTSKHIAFEPREVTLGDEAVTKYFVTLDPATSLEELSSQLMNDGASRVKSVAWEKAKKKWTL